MKRLLASVVAVVAISAMCVIAVQPELFPQLKSTLLIGRQSGDFYITVTNQLLRPWGETFAIKGRPVDLALDSSGRTLAVLNSAGVLLRDGPRALQ